MSTSIANITWANVPGSLNTKVEYKLSTSSTWVVPPSPQNPTTNNFYPLDIIDGFIYDVRLTTNGANCGPRSVTFQIINPGGAACCPATYTMSPDGTYCYKYTDISATPPASGENAAAVQHLDYSAWGSLIYNPGYNINGTGTFTQIPYTNTFWVNGAGFPSGTGLTTTAGPLNRAGVWSTSVSDGQIIGYSVCITAPVTGTYYVGTGADNFTSITVDGVTILSMDPIAMAAYLNANGYGGLSTEVTFRFWHIYPITLTAGDHIVEIIGNNVTSVASIGAEIYNATSTEIAAATSYPVLGSKLLFSSKDYIGQPIQIGSGGVGYTCPANYSLVMCQGAPFCRLTSIVSTVPCSGGPVVYYGANFTGIPPDEATILVSSTVATDGQGDTTIDWTPFNFDLQWCWFAIPNLGPDYNKNEWFVNLVNQGAIGGPTNLFGDPIIVNVNTIDYLVWITNYATQFTQVCEVRKV